jgi:16S rRNA (adenine1518-N6/adenine1519-N6)-dimethyltransferase
MEKVRAKKGLGQHFLKDKNIARKVSESLSGAGYDSVLEIGPGMGILTQFLLDRKFPDLRVVEIDNESVRYLRAMMPEITNIIEGDFLRIDIAALFPGKCAIIGNFPYNISSQIMFRILEKRDMVVEVVGMFQREVAERICSGPGSKTYGILSVLLQAFYHAEYLFTVPESVFSPPPKVKYGVIRLRRNNLEKLDCDEELFFRVVKSCFNQRRKMLRNSVRSAFEMASMDYSGLNLRPEQLSIGEFIDLTGWISRNRLK